MSETVREPVSRRPPLRLVRPEGPAAATGPGIWIGNQRTPLPEGVSEAEWTLEKVSIQNPRVRSLLGCADLLEEVMDSNFAILHCSPERLKLIQGRVSEVARLIRDEIGPLLGIRSKIPSLEAARRSAELSLQTLSITALAEVERLPALLEAGHVMQVRKLLCVSIGKLHAFLQDTFGKIMAGDPRSRHDSDYFLSRRFPRDVEEAEWLYTTVDRLYDSLRLMGPRSSQELHRLADRLRREGTIPGPEAWRRVRLLLDQLLDELAPMFKEILAQRGIRFDEMEMLDRYALDIPTRSRLLVELQATGCEVGERILGERAGRRSLVERIADLTTSHAIVGRRMAILLDELGQVLDELGTFVPIWLRHIELRRALLLWKEDGEPGDPSLRGEAEDLGLREEPEDLGLREEPEEPEAPAPA